MSAEEAKNKGNAAFSAKNFEEAIEHFTTAIGLDAGNHVLYSNRSAAYASLHKYTEALADADKCISIKPDWAKGYSRKGAAQHGLGDFEGAIETYNAGLKIEPTNAMLKSGLQEADHEFKMNAGQQAKQSLGNLFGRPDLLDIIVSSPDLAPYVAQQDFMEMVQNLQKDPLTFTQYQSDPRCMTLLQVLLQRSNPDMFAKMAEKEQKEMKKREEDAEARKKREEAEKKAALAAETERKLTMSEDDIAKLEGKEQCEIYKMRGTAAYKAKDFDNALKAYTKGFEADRTNISLLTNRAAVHFEMGNLDLAEADSREAIKVGRECRADFASLARAFERLGNIQLKRGNLNEAMDEYNNSMLENRTPSVEKKIKDLKAKIKLQEAEAYKDAGKSAEAKEKGNALVKEGSFPAAITAYEEAIKRNPKDHTLYSNLALCYLKLMEPARALAHCNTALELEPTFARAYLRRGNAYVMLREMTRALDDFQHGCELDPSNAELKEALQRVKTSYHRGRPDEAVTQNALKDPVIKQILADPVVKNLLTDMQTDASAVQRAMADPDMSVKIERLLIAGVVGIGPGPAGH
eukprot:CAMPEP_0114557490 /NCGR_PEP_ID=MMETSP0114-20121206/9859_1 /TAXON_ID=31324 /ORGANISM="Goniomonas sp, Strain m" /LENGTH=577 /DNA_ID=CAMNT_0001742783 /DNA_START=13 /DNA_END=1746 /DNA_ORIENTATION=+